MSKELVISSSPHETKVAVLEDDQLVEMYYERDTHTGLVGGIYKGRVNRVLPGMQSAFVDIGLDRDAFLYVSDFFEDAEEYDKVVADVEARVTRYTESTVTPPAEAAAPGAGAIADIPETPAEAPVDEATSIPAPAGMIVDAVEQQPPVVEPAPVPAPSPAAAESPASAPSAPPVSHGYDRPQGQHQDFRHDSRGRRRRRHGRHFGDQKFRPRPEFRDRPAERPDLSGRGQTAAESGPSHAFEVLPGESLAKYKHSSAPPTEQAGASAEPSEHHVATGDEARQHDSPLAGAVAPHIKLTAEAEHPMAAPQCEAASAELSPMASEALRRAVQGEAPPLKVSAEPVAEPQREILTPGEASSEEAREDGEPVALAGPAGAALKSGSKSEPTTAESAQFEEMSPPPSTEFEAAAEDSTKPLVAEPEAGSKPRPLWDRLVSTVLGREAGTETHPADAPAPDVEPVPPPGPADVSMNRSATRTPRPVDEGAEVPEAGVSEAGSPLGGTEPVESRETAPGAPPAGHPTEQGAPPAREYSLREPYQRPRFAPRRRGRFGRGRDFGSGGQGPRRELPRSGNNQPVQIAELLKEGQEILVQIAKEPLGRKGARITSHIALPGRYLVYMPTVDHIGVSRKIASEEERLRLKNIILDHRSGVGGGFIVRTAGAGRPEDELKADMNFLTTLWSDIKASAEKTKAPALLHRDLDLMQRILRDILSPEFKTVRVDNEIEYERAVEFVNRCQPSLVGHVKLYTKDNPILEELGIQAEIDKALKSKVWLKSGGYIVINQTEALVAIDVNTGKYVGKTNRLEDTIVKTNIDAVKEIVRQIRLRDLGGIIVIDFIDMDERRNRNKVVQALEEALRGDRAPTKVLSFNDFGLVAITRKRVKQSLERTLCEPCNYCSGSGWVKSVTTVCYEILAEARKMASEREGNTLTLRVHPEVARALKSRQGIVLSELESLTHKDVIVKSDPNVHQERFEIY